MGKDIGEVVTATAHVDRHPHDPRFTEPEQHSERGGAVGQHDRDAVAWSEALLPEPSGKRERHEVNFAERDWRAVEPRIEAVRRCLRLVRQQGDETVIRGEHGCTRLQYCVAV
jgi:hypothetical protein